MPANRAHLCAWLSVSFCRDETVFWDQLSAHQWEVVPKTATSLGLRLAGVELRGQPRDYEQALTQAPPEYRSALFVLASPLFYADRWRLAELALRHRMVSMFAFREYVEAGGLFSYGPSLNGLMKPADYVDRIARGKKPPICRSNNRPSSS